MCSAQMGLPANIWNLQLLESVVPHGHGTHSTVSVEQSGVPFVGSVGPLGRGYSCASTSTERVLGPKCA